MLLGFITADKIQFLPYLVAFFPWLGRSGILKIGSRAGPSLKLLTLCCQPLLRTRRWNRACENHSRMQPQLRLSPLLIPLWQAEEIDIPRGPQSPVSIARLEGRKEAESCVPYSGINTASKPSAGLSFQCQAIGFSTKRTRKTGQETALGTWNKISEIKKNLCRALLGKESVNGML